MVAQSPVFRSSAVVLAALGVLCCSGRSGDHPDAATGVAGVGGRAGESGSAGGTNTGGTAGTGAAGGAPCTEGNATISFRLDSAERLGWFVIDSGHDCTPPNWLSIYDSMGNELAVGNPDLHCCTLANCRTCSFDDVACENIWQTLPLPASRTWDGMIFPRGSCGASGTACVMGKTCTPPGEYHARMCARHYVNEQEQMTCVEVTFTVPATGTVLGNLQQY